MKPSMLHITAALIIAQLLAGTLPAYSNPDKAQTDSINQAKLQQFENKLAVLGDSLLDAQLEEDRIQAVRQFIPKLVEALQVPGSLRYPFDSLEFMFTHTPKDSSFRLYNWTMQFDDGLRRYYGAIHMNKEDAFILYPLTDKHHELSGDTDEKTLDHNRWRGAIYYDMTTVTSGDETYYTLIGYDEHDDRNQIKLLDVLHFDETGAPVFGAPLFEVMENDERQRKHRVEFTYSNRAVMTVDLMDGANVIIYDNLVPLDAGSPSHRPEMVPDGSYSSFVWESGLWRFVEHPFDRLDMFQEGP